MFSTVRHKLINSTIWTNMSKTTEASPYHRETSVAIHTEMVLDEFAKMDDMPNSDIIKLALLFHDTGKPVSKRTKFKEERGNYFSFAGHEQQSARIFENFYAENYANLFKSWLSPTDAYKVMWLIENHLPFNLNMEKLKTVLVRFMPELEHGFYAHVMADTLGRISDDYAIRDKKATEFVELMRIAEPMPKFILKDNAPTLRILIGASGSGKSTYVKDCLTQGYAHYSYDDIRVLLAKSKSAVFGNTPAKIYSEAWNYCDKHRSEFGHFADVEYIKLIKDYRDIVVDNTNVTKKHRIKFTAEARKRGYRIEAVVFPISEAALLARANLRTDKEVPDDVVLSQYNRIHLPWVGTEVDSLIVRDNNLQTK
jgi:predicted kinase